jgi:hypothetical protein
MPDSVSAEPLQRFRLILAVLAVIADGLGGAQVASKAGVSSRRYAGRGHGECGRGCAVWIACGVLPGGESSESRSALEQAEFVVEVRGHRAQPGDGVAATGEPERDRFVGAGAGDIQRLPVNRD